MGAGEKRSRVCISNLTGNTQIMEIDMKTAQGRLCKHCRHYRAKSKDTLEELAEWGMGYCHIVSYWYGNAQKCVDYSRAPGGDDD